MPLSWQGIRDNLARTSSSLTFQRSFSAIRRTNEPMSRFRDPAALLDTLHRRGGDTGEKNRILASLVQAAQADRSTDIECAITLLLLALWPGLDTVFRRARRRRLGTSDELASEIIARTTDAIARLELARVNWIATTILMNVERDLGRAHRRQVAHDGRRADVELDELAAIAPEPYQSAAERLQCELATMLGPDGVLVMRVALEGYSQIEVAGELGLTESAARKRYQRATARLRGRLPEFLGADVPIGRASWLFSSDATTIRRRAR